MIPDYHQNWLDLINQRDAFYLYVFLIGLTAYLCYRWLRLFRYFKYLVMILALVVCGGIAWGVSVIW